LERISGRLFYDPSVKNQYPPLPLPKNGDPQPNQKAHRRQPIRARGE
jgi:hypothetical protein